ncbi:hypothetical protein GCG54_00003892 [Colletotrichum gloeosporioides]|uniref:DUF6594 domain-containing protein n=1 Tax=Colletotrichum gloeosporioides TaxID=474922 RepID=A0A8H4C667_COLGL|nr:uncharacterized protein GCG54_00003892 [Colletotrichum gloeosporioides]KAF3797992.1 hypothetical protein GCG54_00003892 [Colletotrichum gloeosporioides]
MDTDALQEQFRAHWESSTADEDVTLYGFSRFRTIHLLNLRFLEGEISELNRLVYQAGKSLSKVPPSRARLGIDSRWSDASPEPSKIINQELVTKVRDLLRQYGAHENTDEALVAFHNIMGMETSYLIDDEQRASLRKDRTADEMYHTRLLRVDLGQRLRKDPMERFVRRCLYHLRYRQLSRWWATDIESGENTRMSGKKACQNTVLVAEVISRFFMTGLVGIFVVIPLAILSYQNSKEVQLGVISACVVTFSCLVSAFLKVSSVEMMMVTTAYGAILTVFMSNV